MDTKTKTPASDIAEGMRLRLIDLRKSMGYKPERMAKELGVTYEAYKKYENDPATQQNRRIPLEVIPVIIEVTGADARHFLTGKGPFRPNLSSRALQLARAWEDIDNPKIKAKVFDAVSFYTKPASFDIKQMAREFLTGFFVGIKKAPEGESFEIAMGEMMKEIPADATPDQAREIMLKLVVNNA